MQCSMRGLVDTDDSQDVVSMWPFSPLRRSDPSATDQKRHAGHRPHSVLGLIVVGVVAGVRVPATSGGECV